jgi:hypothetical protein
MEYPMSDQNQPLTLALHFDADQTDSRLVVNLPPGARPTTGKYAGVVVLSPHSRLPVVLVGSGMLDNPYGPRFEHFKVNDLCLVSSPNVKSYGPHHRLPRFFAPSPLEHHSERASHRIPSDGVMSDESTAHYLSIIDRLNEPLHLGRRGSWSLSIVLTVEIYRADVAEPELRVFHANVDLVLAETSEGSID